MSRRTMRNVTLACLAIALAVLLQAEDRGEQTMPEMDGLGMSGRSAMGELGSGLVWVDVHVTDTWDHHVGGLTLDDFELREDGREVPITSFFAAENAAAIGGRRDLEPVGDDDPSPVFATVEASEDQRLWLAVFLDRCNLSRFDREHAQRFVQALLRESPGPGDRVMLLSGDREVNERSSFTSDPEAIAVGFDEIEELSGPLPDRDADRRNLLGEIARTEALGRVLERVQNHAASQVEAVASTLGALRDLVDDLAGLPGRKAVLYVGDGLMLRPGEDLFHALDRRFPGNNLILKSYRYDLIRRFQVLASVANGNRVELYALQAADRDADRPIRARKSGRVGTRIDDPIHLRNLQSSLQLLAKETGGLALVDTAEVSDGLARVRADFRNRYALGFHPAPGGTGRYKGIEVRVKGREDLLLRYRSGYRDKPFATRMDEATLAALVHGYRENPLGLSVEVEGVARRSDGHVEVALALRLPIGKLALLPDTDSHRGQVRVFIVARDAEGRTSDGHDLLLDLDIPTAEAGGARSEHHRHDLDLLLRPGDHRVAVGVGDLLAAEISVVVLDVAARLTTPGGERTPAAAPTARPPSTPFLRVLGIAQDGGLPHAACEHELCRRAREDRSLASPVASLGLVVPGADRPAVYLVDATPDVREQLDLLRDVRELPADRVDRAPLDGVLLTHAHIGHYLGLAFFGFEAVHTRGLRVVATPRMAAFLRANEPWKQLVALENIALDERPQGSRFRLGVGEGSVEVAVIAVPHRDELSDTVGYVFAGPNRRVLYVPDTDGWQHWRPPLPEVLADHRIDVALVDGSFFSMDELPGRDIATIRHPLVTQSMDLLEPWVAAGGAVLFIHLNHSNPALDPDSEARAAIEAGGFAVAEVGQEIGL